MDSSVFQDEYKNPALRQRHLDADWESGKSEANTMKRTKRSDASLKKMEDNKDEEQELPFVNTDTREEESTESKQSQVHIDDGRGKDKDDNIEIHFEKDEEGGEDAHIQTTTI